MKSVITTLVFICCLFGINKNTALAQGGYHFGVKGGVTLANQNWNDNERRVLLALHGNVFIESRDADDKGALFAQIGMHTRGSSITTASLGFGNLQTGYRFQNISLLAGARKKISPLHRATPYYMVGIRAEYTVANNLAQIQQDFCSNLTAGFGCPFPDPFFVRELNYGITIGGGLEFAGTEFFTPAIEFSISPDLSFQYDRPRLENVVNAPGGVLQQARVRNITFEVSLVFKFLREIVYTDN